MATRKSNKKSNKRFRKTRSKRKRGGDGGEVKIAVLLITTHGSLDHIEDEVTHDIDLNVHKINATTPGVCNFVEDEELLDELEYSGPNEERVYELFDIILSAFEKYEKTNKRSLTKIL